MTFLNSYTTLFILIIYNYVTRVKVLMFMLDTSCFTWDGNDVIDINTILQMHCIRTAKPKCSLAV